MSDYVAPGTPSDESDGPIDMSRFQEDGAGFTIVEDGEGDLPVYDWQQKQEEIITEEDTDNAQ
jgi:hypothetical protein